MRPIDANKLIEELEELEDAYRFYHDEAARGFASAICKVNDQPTIQPQIGWIPVSSGEKPKNDEYYIITTNDGLVECAHRRNKRWYTEEATCGWYGDNEILAYMPLPQPYKESE